MSPPLTVTEDTPADMLAGSMDLHIVLPSGQVVRTSVLRSTPMMDLLVQVTTAHRLSPGNHSLQAMGERDALPYKPSTPIGALDTFTVRIVKKKPSCLKRAPQIPQPMQTTFRLQVHLPRSQLFVVRVTPQVTVGDVLKQVCREKNLDTHKYELRNTADMNRSLELENTLGELDTQELTLIVRGADQIQQLSSADIMHVKQANNRQNSMCDSSLSSGSLGSRSISPVVMPAPQPPQRKKRRPAPKPPDTQTRSVVISHSRESSDSSGYHEPSTLSESPTHGGPPSDISTSRGNRGLSNMTARNTCSMSNLTSIPTSRLPNSVSVTSLSSNGPSKKKRAPPPPPILSPAKENVADIKIKSSTLPSDTRRIPDAAIIVPSPPVELAPSPPTSPDIDIPIPMPRQTKPNINANTPSIAPRSPQPTITKEPAVDIGDYELTVEKESSETLLEEGEDFDIENSDLPPLPEPDWDMSEPEPRSLSPQFDKPKPLKTSKSTTTLNKNKIVPVIQKTLSANDALGLKIQDDFELIRWENSSRINYNYNDDIEDILSAKNKFDKEELDDINKEPLTSLDEPTTSLDSEPDSLTVDWEYQLPPPPSHFRDVTPPRATPAPTDIATLGTLGTLDTIVTLDLDKDIDKDIEGVDRLLHPLNGIYEDAETENAKKVVFVKQDVGPKMKLSTEEAKVLVHKSDVMNELTNILKRGRLQEKSQSVSNLYIASADQDVKKKAHTISHSQSFANPPIPNFNISNYLERSAKTMEDVDDFKKPSLPAIRSNGVRRADSMNIKKVDAGSLEVLKQQFIEFLKTNRLQETGVKFEDLNVIPSTLTSVQECEIEKTTPVVVEEVKKVVVTEIPVEETKPKEEIPVEEKRIDSAPKMSVVVKLNEENAKNVRRSMPEHNKVQNIQQQQQEIPKKIEVKRPIFVSPAIRMGTWNDRPKSTVVIRDKDYTTQVNLTERRPVEIKPPAEPTRPAPEKKVVTVTKKVTNYELFSSPSRFKDQPDVEEEKELPRPPVVCAVELKKEFRPEPDLIMGLQNEKRVIKVENSIVKPDVPKTTSVYVNGFMKPQSRNVDAQNTTKARPGLMPVVKGFRENHTQINISNENKPEPVQKQTSLPEMVNRVNGSFKRQESLPVKLNGVVENPGIPPPPPMGSIKLRPASDRQIKPKVNDDPRDQLLEQIRSFDSSSRLRKTVQ